jgi:hypothetical protein
MNILNFEPQIFTNLSLFFCFALSLSPHAFLSMYTFCFIDLCIKRKIIISNINSFSRPKIIISDKPCLLLEVEREREREKERLIV